MIKYNEGCVNCCIMNVSSNLIGYFVSSTDTVKSLISTHQCCLSLCRKLSSSISLCPELLLDSFKGRIMSMKKKIIREVCIQADLQYHTHLFDSDLQLHATVYDSRGSRFLSINYKLTQLQITKPHNQKGMEQAIGPNFNYSYLQHEGS